MNEKEGGGRGHWASKGPIPQGTPSLLGHLYWWFPWKGSMAASLHPQHEGLLIAPFAGAPGHRPQGHFLRGAQMAPTCHPHCTRGRLEGMHSRPVPCTGYATGCCIWGQWTGEWQQTGTAALLHIVGDGMEGCQWLRSSATPHPIKGQQWWWSAGSTCPTTSPPPQRCQVQWGSGKRARRPERAGGRAHGHATTFCHSAACCCFFPTSSRLLAATCKMAPCQSPPLTGTQ